MYLIYVLMRLPLYTRDGSYNITVILQAYLTESDRDEPHVSTENVDDIARNEINNHRLITQIVRL